MGSIYNAQKFTVPGEMFIQVPLVMILSQGTTADAMTSAADYAMSLKNGYIMYVDTQKMI